MKKLSYLLLLLLYIGCQNDSSNKKAEKELDSNLINHSKEYSWTNMEFSNPFGEILFLPVYSSVYHQTDRTFELASTLSIHNADLNNPINILKIDYYDTDGNLVRKFIKEKVQLQSLQSKQFVIEESDITGGTAAKFVVQWIAEKNVIKPVIETLMISTSSQQGISFKGESKIISSIGY
jgi:hypothetical protein